MEERYEMSEGESLDTEDSDEPEEVLPEQVKEDSGILVQTESHIDSITSGIPLVDLNDIIPQDFNFGF